MNAYQKPSPAVTTQVGRRAGKAAARHEAESTSVIAARVDFDNMRVILSPWLCHGAQIQGKQELLDADHGDKGL
jgi:hypothetical protein